MRLSWTHRGIPILRTPIRPAAGRREEKVSASDGYISARNVLLIKGKKIVQEWTTSEWPTGYPPSTLELDLKKVAEGTELTMTHSKVPEEQADDYAEGWKEYYWDPMVEYFQKKKRDMTWAGHILGANVFPTLNASATDGPIER